MSSDTKMGIIRPDVLAMYAIALILDVAGIILFFISLTVLLAPIAVVLQWIIALIGNVLFSVWILFLRPTQSGSAKQSSAPSIKSQTQRISTKKGSGRKSGAVPTPSASLTSSAKKSAPIKKWFKQVLLVWGIESIPVIGAISCTWIVAVYLEQKKG